MDKKCLFYGLKCLVFEWSARSCDQTISKTGQSVRKFQISVIQMVTVFYLLRSNWAADAVVDLSLVLDGHNILIA